MKELIKKGVYPLRPSEIEELTGLKICGKQLTQEIDHASIPTLINEGCLIFLDNENSCSNLNKINASKNILVLVNEDFSFELSVPHLICEHPRQIWGKLVKALYNYEDRFVFHEDKQLQNCEIGERVRISKSAIISHNCKIGDETVIQDNVFLAPYSIIGKNCTLMTGTIVGAQGFGAMRYGISSENMPHIGGVIINDGCELGAGNVIDAGTIFPTILASNVKTGSLVHIAHNVKVGEGTFMAARSGVSGSSTIGKHCFIGAGAMIKDWVTIGDRAKVGLMSAVVKDVAKDTQVAGNPAREMTKNDS